jgi:hypothetical protein
MPWDINNFITQLKGGFGKQEEQNMEQEKLEDEKLKKILERLKIDNVIEKKKQDDGWYQLKVEKEKLNMLDRFMKMFGKTPTETETINTNAYGDMPEETPQPQVLGESVTPTPEQPNLGEIEPILQMLGLGTTWAGGDKKPVYPDELVPYANEAGQQYGIDPIILAAQDAQETGGFNYEPRVGTSGEQGIPQIIPRFHYKNSGVGDSNTYASKLANDPKYAIGEQARILSGYLKGQGNIYDALRQYNAGGVLENSGTYADEILKRAGLEKLIPGYNL